MPTTQLHLSPAPPALSEQTSVATVLSWKEAAILVLVQAGEPLRASQIVSRIGELGLTTASRTRTPTQSINRDLHSALRQGDPRLVPGPQPGQFCAAGTDVAALPAPTGPARRVANPRGPRLPVEPLQAAVAAVGGVTAAGFGKSGSRDQKRLSRTFHRSIKRGWIDLYDADAIAVHHLGVHPCLLWGAGWWDTLAEADRNAGLEQGVDPEEP